MRQDRPSFTAQRVAAQRARLDRPSTSDGNPDAERRLYEGLGNPLLFTRIDSGRMRRRTEWFDRATLEAVNDSFQKMKLNHFYDATAPDATHDNNGPGPQGQRSPG